MFTLLFSLISACRNCSGKVTLYLCQRFYFFQTIFQIFFFYWTLFITTLWGRQWECIAIHNHILPILQTAKLKNVLAKVMYYKVGAAPAQTNHFPITSPEPYWFTPKIALKHGHVFEFHRQPQPWIALFFGVQELQLQRNCSFLFLAESKQKWQAWPSSWKKLYEPLHL